MVAIADCAKAINKLVNVNGDKEMQQLIQITEFAMQRTIANATSTPITTRVPESLKVKLYTNNNTQQTRSMTPQISQIPQLSTPSLPRVDCYTKTKHNPQTKKHETKLHTLAPSHNTRFRTQATGPTSRTRSRIQSRKIKTAHIQDAH